MTADLATALAAIQATQPSSGAVEALSARGPAGVVGSPMPFGQMVNQGLSSVNEALVSSQTDLQQLATGNAQNLHQIMIKLEESRLSFQMLMQVRNRLLDAYQDVMKMQV